jgi:hypothetical protein
MFMLYSDFVGEAVRTASVGARLKPHAHVWRRRIGAVLRPRISP